MKYLWHWILYYKCFNFIVKPCLARYSSLTAFKTQHLPQPLLYTVLYLICRVAALCSSIINTAMFPLFPKEMLNFNGGKKKPGTQLSKTKRDREPCSRKVTQWMWSWWIWERWALWQISTRSQAKSKIRNMSVSLNLGVLTCENSVTCNFVCILKCDNDFHVGDLDWGVS